MLRTSKGSGFAGSLGPGRLSTSLKCCTRLAACSLLVVITFPSLSLTGLVLVLLRPLKCFVILYTVLRSSTVAFSALSDNSSATALVLTGTPLNLFVFDLLLFFCTLNQSSGLCYGFPPLIDFIPRLRCNPFLIFLPAKAQDTILGFVVKMLLQVVSTVS